MSILSKLGIAVLLVPWLVMLMSLFVPNVEASPTIWCIETVDASAEVGVSSSIAIDSDGFPHIAYYDMYWENLKYAKWTGTAWSIEPVDTVGSVGLHTSLALDSGGNPHISYYDFTNGDLKYARWTGSAWNIEIVDSNGDVGQYCSLALDSSGNPHISYFDAINQNLKYATTSDEYFASVNVTPFDSDSDGQNDAVEVQMNVDTSYTGTLPVKVNAFLADYIGDHADNNSTTWNITGQSVEWMTIYLHVPPGYFEGPSMYNVQLSLFDDDDFFEDFHQETGIYLYPSSTVTPTVFIESCNSIAERKDIFELGETVYVYGNGFSPSTGYSLYVVDDQETWTEGMIIPERVPGTEPWVSSNTEGGISPTAVWHDPQTMGNYDIVVDVNGNDHYDAGVDALDDADVEVAAGVSVIPEFSTILPFFILLTSLSVILLKKKMLQ